MQVLGRKKWSGQVVLFLLAKVSGGVDGGSAPLPRALYYRAFLVVVYVLLQGAIFSRSCVVRLSGRKGRRLVPGLWVPLVEGKAPGGVG